MVVVVPGEGDGAVGEGGGEGAFEEEVVGVFGDEFGVDAGVVEGLVVVGEDFDGFGPGAEGGVGLGEPDFPEVGGFSVELGEDGEPFFAVWVPADGAAVGGDGGVLDGGDFVGRGDFLPG